MAPHLPIAAAPSTSGAPITTNLRHVVNAILYRLPTGCPWRGLPKDFDIPWKTVYNGHETFARLGTWGRVQRALAARVRAADGRPPQPSVLIVDAQTVKAAETAGEVGFDGGEGTRGRKRHALVDSLGLAFAAAVTAAHVGDARGAALVLGRVADNPWPAAVYADAAYRRDRLDEYRTASRACYQLVIVSRPAGQVGVRVPPRRRVVGRPIAWLRHSRLLAREYEGRPTIPRGNVCLRAMLLAMNQ